MRTCSRLLPALLLPAVLVGCAESPEPIEAPAPVSVEAVRVPEGVSRAARRALPGVEFEQVWKIQENGGLNYGFRGRDEDGRTREVKVSSTGKVLGTE